MPPVNGAILQKEFDRIDKDQSGTLDRDEVKKLLNNLDPRTGITNEELDNFMEEVDASGDDQIDFQEFKEYWEKNLDADGSDQALTQIKENRALVASLTEKWGLDTVEEESAEVNPLVKIENGEQLTANDLRGRSLPELKQILKKCGSGSRNAALVQGQIETFDAAKVHEKHAKLSPGQLMAGMMKARVGLQKEQGKKKPDAKKIGVFEDQLTDMQGILDEKVQFSGLLTKKGGKTGQKGQAERWFCLEEVSSGVWSMEYYDPKNYKLLGQIPIDRHCLIVRGETAAGKVPMYTLDITCQQQGRTYYMFTEDETARDTWFDFIVKDSGVQHTEHDSDDHDDEIAHTESEESEESEDSDDETAPVSDMDTVTSNNDAVDEDLE